MTITIVGDDENKKRRATCGYCSAILEYTQADTKTYIVRDYSGCSETYRRIICPRCKEPLTVPLF